MIHRLFPSLLFLALIPLSQGCQTAKSSSTLSSRPSSTTRVSMPQNPVSNIAEREIIRRQQRIRSADEAALRAGQKSAAGDQEGALKGYEQALNALPE